MRPALDLPARALLPHQRPPRLQSALFRLHMVPTTARAQHTSGIGLVRRHAMCCGVLCRSEGQGVSERRLAAVTQVAGVAAVQCCWLSLSAVCNAAGGLVAVTRSATVTGLDSTGWLHACSGGQWSLDRQLAATQKLMGLQHFPRLRGGCKEPMQCC